MQAVEFTLANHYIDRKAIAHGTFTLASGAQSDFYIDGRLVTTYPPALSEIAKQMVSLINRRHLLRSDSTLVTPVLSGIPIVVALALTMDRHYLIDRGTPKNHGHGKRFEGEFESAGHCLVIDDLITAGGTIIHTIEGLRAEGKVVTDAVVVIDREEGGRAALEAINVRLHTLLTKSQLMDALSALEHSQNGYAHTGVA